LVLGLDFAYNPRVATSHRGQVRIGCAGWNYKQWKAPVYDGAPQRLWLTRYAERFGTVEVNSTFYRLPTRRSSARWADEAPAGFLFALKVSRYLTHVVRLRDTAIHLALLLERVEPLEAAARLGPLLWQLPPTFRRDEQRLATMLDQLPTTIRHAVEFRHPSWFVPSVLELLRAHNVALVVADRPGARELRGDELTADFVYVRFHHGSRGRRGNYSQRELEGWAGTIGEWLSDRDVFVYFNNDWEGFAPANAEAMKSLVATGA